MWDSIRKRCEMVLTETLIFWILCFFRFCSTYIGKLLEGEARLVCRGKSISRTSSVAHWILYLCWSALQHMRPRSAIQVNYLQKHLPRSNWWRERSRSSDCKLSETSATMPQNILCLVEWPLLRIRSVICLQLYLVGVLVDTRWTLTTAFRVQARFGLFVKEFGALSGNAMKVISVC